MILDPGGASTFREQVGKGAREGAVPGARSSPVFTCIYNLEACFPSDPSHAGQVSPAKTAFLYAFTPCRHSYLLIRLTHTYVHIALY